ncbi:hypothetical protein Pelo_16121 [Pelomyxa schiedti]|nr:hypothetical protein Pelo_16121 [Pelomyxa schiedti]
MTDLTIVTTNFVYDSPKPGIAFVLYIITGLMFQLYFLLAVFISYPQRITNIALGIQCQMEDSGPMVSQMGCSEKAPQ